LLSRALTIVRQFPGDRDPNYLRALGNTQKKGSSGFEKGFEKKSRWHGGATRIKKEDSEGGEEIADPEKEEFI